jgi:hypothetical protein
LDLEAGYSIPKSDDDVFTDGSITWNKYTLVNNVITAIKIFLCAASHRDVKNYNKNNIS